MFIYLPLIEMNTQQVSNKLSEKALLGLKNKPAKLWARWYKGGGKIQNRKIKGTRLNDVKRKKIFLTHTQTNKTIVRRLGG